MSLFWWFTLFAMLAGIALFFITLVKRPGWWWKLPLAFALIVGPYLGDVVRCRLINGEGVVSAMMPTSLMLNMLGPDTKWPYGNLFDRLNKAPQRHALWQWQLDTLAHWCSQRVDEKDLAMVKRGVQIAGTLASRGCEPAIHVVAEGLSHPDVSIRLLACDILMGAEERARTVLPQIELAADKDASAEVRTRAGKVRMSLKQTQRSE